MGMGEVEPDPQHAAILIAQGGLSFRSHLNDHSGRIEPGVARQQFSQAAASNDVAALILRSNESGGAGALFESQPGAALFDGLRIPIQQIPPHVNARLKVCLHNRLGALQQLRDRKKCHS